MTNQVNMAEPTDVTRKTAAQIGFCAAILMTIFTAVAFAIAVATPPISGPFCQNGCVTYPYVPPQNL